MKLNITKLMTVMMVIIMVTGMLAGCSTTTNGLGVGQPTTDDLGVKQRRNIKEPSGAGFEIGLGMRYWGPFSGNTACAVKSNYSVFDVEDVELEFHFGSKVSDIMSHTWEASDYINFDGVGIALYFYDWDPSKTYFFMDNYSKTYYDDYRNLDGCYFVKDILAGELSEKNTNAFFAMS